jgi:hypothetical protein
MGQAIIQVDGLKHESWLGKAIEFRKHSMTRINKETEDVVTREELAFARLVI